MNHDKDLNNRRNNQTYYNKMRNAQRRKRNRKSFASKEVNIKDMVFAPEGYEGIFFFAYFLIIPYLAGSIFLFLFVAGGNYDSFMLLNMTAVFIVWAIGYEIVATIALSIIFIMFLFYDDDS